MNPHYHHPYPDLSSPHSPNSDGVPSSYRGHTPTGGPPNGHIMGPHHDHLQPHPAYVGGGQLNHHGNVPNSLNNYHHHHHYHHFLNNNNNNNNSNSGNNNNSSSNQNGVHMCAGCGTKIMDRFLLKMMDQTYHHHCLKCQVCQCTLADVSPSCFTKDNMILCKRDYLQWVQIFLFIRTCTRGLCTPNVYSFGGTLRETLTYLDLISFEFFNLLHKCWISRVKFASRKRGKHFSNLNFFFSFCKKCEEGTIFGIFMKGNRWFNMY